MENNLEDYYSEEETVDLVDGLEQLKEYLCGWDDAIVCGKFKKKYVNMYCNR